MFVVEAYDVGAAIGPLHDQTAVGGECDRHFFGGKPLTLGPEHGKERVAGTGDIDLGKQVALLLPSARGGVIDRGPLGVGGIHRHVGAIPHPAGESGVRGREAHGQ